jgi:hypothetical protein
MYMYSCSHFISYFRHTFHISTIENKVIFIIIGYLALFVNFVYYNSSFHLLIIDKKLKGRDIASVIQIIKILKSHSKLKVERHFERKYHYFGCLTLFCEPGINLKNNIFKLYNLKGLNFQNKPFSST